jgi:hypothetical protein
MTTFISLFRCGKLSQCAAAQYRLKFGEGVALPIIDYSKRRQSGRFSNNFFLRKIEKIGIELTFSERCLTPVEVYSEKPTIFALENIKSNNSSIHPVKLATHRSSVGFSSDRDLPTRSMLWCEICQCSFGHGAICRCKARKADRMGIVSVSFFCARKRRKMKFNENSMPYESQWKPHILSLCKSVIDRRIDG